jgi:hypothetical protein
MIKFKQFRASLNEDDGTTQPVNNDNKQTQMDMAFSAIDSEIDKWVFDLKKTMVTPPSVSPTGQAGTGQVGQAGQRGVWDRFKNFLANVRHGRYDPKNPYRWQNTIGDYLGQKVEESVSPSNLSLSDYKKLRTICENMEQDLQSLPTGTEKLHIIRIIDSKSAQLKQVIRNILSRLFPAEPQQGKEPNQVRSDGFGSAEEMQKYQQANNAARIMNQDQNQNQNQDQNQNQNQDQNQNQNQDQNQNQNQDQKSAKKGRGRPRKEINTIPPPEIPPPEIPPQQIQWSKLSPEEKAVTPPTKEKNDWDELTKAEQDNWNNYGGGRSNLKFSNAEIREEIKKFTKFRVFPIIFRIGDPRTKIVKNALQSDETNNPEITKILDYRFEKENEINNSNDLNKKINDANEADQKISNKIQSNESWKQKKTELDRKIGNWEDKINFEIELENIKGGNRDDWNEEDYDEAAEIIYQKYKEKLNKRFNEIGHESIKKESIKSLEQEEKESNKSYFERLDNLKEILEKSINSYKDILRPKIEDNQSEEFEEADSIPKLNNIYNSVKKNMPESYSIIKLKERLLFKEYNQKNIKNLTVNERTEYFKKLLRNR